MIQRKKLIEVALPLDEINVAAAKEKSIRHGHPSTLHLWWARRPLAACRAVLFASLVDDPSSDPNLTETAAEQERERLFGIIRDLVKWENSNDPEVLAKARAEIRRCCGDNPPPVLDPFCGGGSIPLEAQRLGLEAHASDLNPVAVLITKALIEIPPKFANRPPVNPSYRSGTERGRSFTGAEGLAADVRHYGQWMRDEARRRIGHLYPKAKLPSDLGGGEATVIAWLWARTVTCPNPACGGEMPLISSFALSTKKGKETWIEPVIEADAKRVRFEVRSGPGGPPSPPKLGRGAKFRCLICGQTATDHYIKDEGRAGRMATQLMAIVAEGKRGRIYLPPIDEQAAIASQARPEWAPSQDLPYEPRAIWCTLYGLTTFADLFTPRQLVALTTFSDLVGEARQRVQHDAIAASLPDDGRPLHEGGTGAQAYADAVATYLAFGVDKMTDTNSAICSWQVDPPRLRATFSRQALPMVWDYAESNPFGDAAGDFRRCLLSLGEVLDRLTFRNHAEVVQADARAETALRGKVVISTDPPYYDNVGYADLSDFFYVWLRRSVGKVFPELSRTLLTPKSSELIATPYRHDGHRDKAQQFFETGLGRAFEAMHRVQARAYPMTVYYAFKQSEDEGDKTNGAATASTGWETMLEGLLATGFAITGTWPMRTELGSRMVGRGTNSLASSIVIVCRPREASAGLATRRDFTNALRQELPDALITLQHGNIAPVDLAQAAIGPGMAIFSRFAHVIEADGSPMRVRTALQLINQELDAYLEAQEGELDTESRFCVAWYDQYGLRPGPYGEADVLARAKGTAVNGMQRAGVLTAEAGKVRLLRRDELPANWDPRTDPRLTIWEATQHLIRRFAEGEAAAGALLAALGPGVGEQARALAYRLFALCERRGRSEEAQAYNGLIVAWPQIQEAAANAATHTYRQEEL